MKSHLITYNQEIMKGKEKKVKHLATMNYNVSEFITHGNHNFLLLMK